MVIVLRLTRRRPARVAAVVAVLTCLAPAVSAQARQVLCHYTYGGETRTLVAAPVSSPYTVKAIDVGSFFHFRVVFEDRPADVAAVKIYTYADRDDGPLLVHQASYAYPPVDAQASAKRGGGFTGWQFVYEPMRDGELQYWCEFSPQAKRAAGQEPGRARDA